MTPARSSTETTQRFLEKIHAVPRLLHFADSDNFCAPSNFERNPFSGLRAVTRSGAKVHCNNCISEQTNYCYNYQPGSRVLPPPKSGLSLSPKRHQAMSSR